LKTQRKYDEACDLLEQAILLLTQHEQFASAAELANLLIEAYNVAGISVTDPSIGTYF